MGENLVAKIVNLKRGNTPINEWIRHSLGITRDEYALCSYIQYRASDPRSKMPGWCSDTKDHLSEFVGITRPGLYKMISRMEKIGLLEVCDANGFVRITAYWMDLEEECQQSLQIKDMEQRKLSLHGFVNKVYTERKLSLQSDVNKVYEVNKGDLSMIEYDLQKDAGTAAVLVTTIEMVKLPTVEPIDESFTPPPAKKTKKDNSEVIQRVVKFLNTSTGAKFRPESKNTVSLINSRIKEGFTESDLIQVVEFKTHDWLNDSKMSEYLRPETLFCLAKFESYLQSSSKWIANGRPQKNISNGSQQRNLQPTHVAQKHDLANYVTASKTDWNTVKID